MRTFSDTERKVDLNPRQIYIILREDNKKYREAFEAIAEDSKNDDIRFCIIDTTELELEKPSNEITTLYSFIMEDDVADGPWDFIVRNYPDPEEHECDIKFSCYHLEKDIKEQLDYIKKKQEKKIWEAIVNGIYERHERMTRNNQRIEAFDNMLNDIMRSKGLPFEKFNDEKTKFECKLNKCFNSKNESQRLVRNFVGDNVNIIDSFFNIKTPRDISDEYMKNFVETGGYIYRPKLEIIENIEKGRVFGGGVHDKYELKVTTTSGITKKVKFATQSSFALYIFYMLNPNIKIRKEDFIKSEDAKNYWESLFAIYASIGETLKNTHGKESLKKFYSDFFKDEKKIWQNSHRDGAAFSELKDEAKPFRIHPTEDNVRKPERWLELSVDYIDLENRQFKADYKDNLKLIENNKLYKEFEKERNENTL